MYLNDLQVEELLNKKDLTQDRKHCVSLIVEKIKSKLQQKYNTSPLIERGSKVVSLQDNYYSLGYGKDEITLGSRYTKYINETTILRTQMSSTIPPLLREYKRDGDKLWLCPGIVYRRDVRDRTHVGEPHQMDIWYLTSVQKNREDLIGLVSVIISVIEESIGKSIQWRYTETSHSYTDNGIEVEIYHNGRWLEILECGLISKKLLKDHGLEGYGGLALGMGLERLAMVIKDIDDIRILMSENPLIKSQLENLDKYKPISNQPATKRDLSVAIDKDINEEELTEQIISSISNETQTKIETIQLISETDYEQLPEIAKQRLGISSQQKNVLLRIILRDIERSLTKQEGNLIYDEIYKKIHKGSVGYYHS